MLKQLTIGMLSYALLFSAPSYAEEESASTQELKPFEPIIIINGEALVQRDYENYKSLREEQSQGNAALPDKRTMIEEMVNRELAVQAALAKNIDKDPNFIARYDALRKSLLAELAVRDFLQKNPPSDEVLKKKYEELVAMTDFPLQYNAAHILVQTEEEAKELIAELEKATESAAERFSELAKEHSTDKASGEKGGELGWVSPKQLVQEFSEAMTALAPGNYSTEPVKTQFGWHIIWLEDTRQTPPPSFESIKSRIQQMLQDTRVQQYMQALKEAAEIEYLIDLEPIEETTDTGEMTETETATKGSAEEPEEEEEE